MLASPPMLDLFYHNNSRREGAFSRARLQEVMGLAERLLEQQAEQQPPGAAAGGGDADSSFSPSPAAGCCSQLLAGRDWPAAAK